MKLTFEDLPSAVSQLCKDVAEIRSQLYKLTEQDISTHSEKPLNVKEASDFLDQSIQTTYTQTSKGLLSVIKLPNSKRNYYLQEDLLAYLKKYRRKSNSEIKSEADNYLIPKKR